LPRSSALSVLLISFIMIWVLRNGRCVNGREQREVKKRRIKHTTCYTPKSPSPPPPSGTRAWALAFPFFGRGIGDGEDCRLAFRHGKRRGDRVKRRIDEVRDGKADKELSARAGKAATPVGQTRRAQTK
jgi:hypothetical protein